MPASITLNLKPQLHILSIYIKRKRKERLMFYQVLYIILSIAVVVVTLIFVVLPAARYKAPESKLQAVENDTSATEEKPIEETTTESKTEN
jgi:hypothetical protein